MFKLFRKGEEDAILNAAGVGFGTLLIEGHNPEWVGMLCFGKSILDDLVENKVLTREEADALYEEMRAAGLPADFAELAAKIAAVELPTKLSGDWNFGPCDCTENIMHGYVRHDDKEIGSPYVNRLSLLNDLRTNAMKGVLTAEEAIFVFQKATSLDLPLDEDAAKARYKSLPQEVRDKLEKEERSSGVMRVFQIPGVGMMIELEIPRDGDGEHKTAKTPADGHDGSTSGTVPTDVPSNGPDQEQAKV